MKFNLSIFLFIVTIFTGCGLSIPGATVPTNSYVCQNSNNSFATCCVGHSGGQTCSPPVNGFYFRSSDMALLCVDGTVSPNCFK